LALSIIPCTWLSKDSYKYLNFNIITFFQQTLINLYRTCKKKICFKFKQKTMK